MHTFADGLFEMELRKKELESEIEQNRMVRLARAGRPRAKRNWSVRLAALWLSDIVAGLRCQLRSRFAADLSLVAC